MYCAFIQAAGDVPVHFFWDTERFPIIEIRGEYLTWEDYFDIFGYIAGKEYMKKAWDYRIMWSPEHSIEWHMREAGILPV